MLLHTRQFLPAEFLPAMKTTGFKLLFHYLMDLGMVGLYVLVFEPLLPGKEWVKASLFSLLPRAVNGFIILPLLGQGLLGARTLTAAGLVYFFIANWLFGLLMGWVYERLGKHQYRSAWGKNEDLKRLSW